jgi:hypothetical protein
MTVKYLRKQFRENLILRAAMVFALPWIVLVVVTLLVLFGEQIDSFAAELFKSGL